MFDACSDTANITGKKKTVQQQFINILIVVNFNKGHTFNKCSHKLLVPPDLKKNPQIFR